MNKKAFLNRRIYGIKIDYVMVVIMFSTLILLGITTGIWKKNKFYNNYSLTVGEPLEKSYSGWTKRKVNYQFITRRGKLIRDRSDYPYGLKVNFDKKYIIAYSASDPEISFLLLDYETPEELGANLDSLKLQVNFAEIPWWKF
ncbi:hypothetical protein QQ020_07580 [Fulvivirgaceae bacterium BMA12]|uniref:DUF3592 domain-containing protein n=1 Tax=Agaribacillus aureus TaxID=3051825 RepID=A0ABT8L3T0_9BACT|nr:hypothetical protein [Fulvivirgaceae bacterium BMA12]